MDIFLQPRASKDAEIGYGMVQSYVCPALDNSKHDFSENTWAIKNTPILSHLMKYSFVENGFPILWVRTSSPVPSGYLT